jgi:serine/threonine protein kinase/tetratricopeptide (TPR) repeat protein
MGVVYEAEQVSLGRRVALKVLPFASALDAKQLQRFQNEARAAAGLHHTHIVPVYGVGCERGVHYYAMQFIDGHTLAAMVAELRRLAGREAVDSSEAAGPAAALASDMASGRWTPQQQGSAEGQPPGPYPPPAEAPGAPTTETTPSPAAAPTRRSTGDAAYFRTVAGLGLQAAEALEHAHQLGVVHRDVKPANLLVDGRGHLWVTDFGLANVQGNAQLTLTGDLVGTLRYMSPEQALGQRLGIDHRTDVYSLGVTLYELLTLEPAFAGSDRQEVLRRITTEEPPPPRRLNKAIPAELETIALKAMEKNPADRYATAQELADDLGRFLRDEPIGAKRPTLVQQARKWTRRHRPVVRTAVTALVLLAGLLVGGAVWLEGQHAARRRVTEQAVTIALARAETLLAEGDKQMEDATHWHTTVQLAVAAVERAEQVVATGEATEELAERVRQTRAAVAAAEADSRLLAGLERIRLEKAAVRGGGFDYARAAPLYAELFGNYGVDLAAPEAAAAKVRGSRLRDALLAALDDWWQATPDEREGQRLGALLEAVVPPDGFWARWRAAGRRRDAAELANLSTEVAVENLPATAVCSLALDLYYAKQGPAAERLLRRAQQRKPNDFWLNHDLGRLLLEQGGPRLTEAVGYLRAALALRSDSPGVYFNLGNALRATGDLEGAVGCYEAALGLDPNYAAAHLHLGDTLVLKKDPDRAIREYEAAVHIDPTLASAHNNLGYLLYVKHDLEGAIRELQTAVALKPRFARAHNNLGMALHDKHDLEGALRAFQAAVAIEPQDAKAHSNLGNVLHERGDWESAVREFRAALQIDPQLAAAHTNLGNALGDKGLFDEALAEHREALRLQKDDPNARDNLRQAEQVARLANRLPEVLQGKDQPKDAAECLAFARLCQLYRKQYRAAARFYEDAFARQPALAEDLPSGNRYNAACAATLAGCGQAQDAGGLSDQERAGLRKQALGWLRAELEACRRLLEKGPDTNRPAIARHLAHGLEDTDFAGVRGEQALAKLPEAERGGWQQLWADVGDTLARAQKQTVPEQKSGTK